MGEYFFGITDKGKRRDKNEDTFILMEAAGKEFVIACVIDGVGGYTGGDVAAGIARAAIIEQLHDLSGDIVQMLRHALATANARILEAKNEEGKNDQMACVLTCAVININNNKFYYAHVGDTRLYLLRDHSLVKISSDHSAVGYLEESGRLSEEDAMRHPLRNEINKALGFEEDIDEVEDFIESGESPFLPGDTIMLCSDGLTDMIGSGTIIPILTGNNSLAVKAQQLVDAANEAGGNDNITAVLVGNNKQPKQLPVLKPVERKNGIEKPLTAPVVKSLKPETRNQKGTSSFLTVFLGLLSLILLIIVFVLLSKKGSTPKSIISAPAMVNQQSQAVNDLISHITDSTKKYSLENKDSVLKLFGAIQIAKDSFYLKGNATTLTCDTNYKGPAFIISPSAKHIVLDSIVFENFDIAVSIQRNNLELKNVRFVNCRIPVQYIALLADSTISGRFTDSTFIPKSIRK